MSAPSPGQDLKTVPYVPLVYEVLHPPIPVKAEGRYQLVYELHLANFSKREITLQKIEVLGGGKYVVKVYQGDQLSTCLTRPGKSLEGEKKLAMEGGSHAVLFILASFENRAEIPDFLTHRLAVESSRANGEKVVMRGEGARVDVVRKEPLPIGPPVRPGVWLAGNCPGDGPVGHRLSMQPWNGKLVVNERYAVDFMKFGQERRLFRGDSSTNAGWYSNGDDVIAVADGVVSDCKDGIVENTPGREYAVPNSLEYAAGNYVILNLGRGIYAVYAHLKTGSLKVKVGNQVRKGQVLGFIGNSGISDAPHLHFHLIDSNSPFGGEGVPFVFEKFELMGPFGSLDDQLLNTWSPKGKSTVRELEMPLGDVVIRFPGTALTSSR